MHALYIPEMLARQVDRGIQDYSSLVVPDARWEDLDPLEFERFLENDTREPGEEAMPPRSSFPTRRLLRPLRRWRRTWEVSAVRVLGRYSGPAGREGKPGFRSGLVVEENQAGRPFRLDGLLLRNQLWVEHHLAVSDAVSHSKLHRNCSFRHETSCGLFLIFLQSSNICRDLPFMQGKVYLVISMK